jgi:hypothetical protein
MMPMASGALFSKTSQQNFFPDIPVGLFQSGSGRLLIAPDGAHAALLVSVAEVSVGLILDFDFPSLELHCDQTLGVGLQGQADGCGVGQGMGRQEFPLLSGAEKLGQALLRGQVCQ